MAEKLDGLTKAQMRLLDYADSILYEMQPDDISSVTGEVIDQTNAEQMADHILHGFPISEREAVAPEIKRVTELHAEIVKSVICATKKLLGYIGTGKDIGGNLAVAMYDKQQIWAYINSSLRYVRANVEEESNHCSQEREMEEGLASPLVDKMIDRWIAEHGETMKQAVADSQ